MAPWARSFHMSSSLCAVSLKALYVRPTAGQVWGEEQTHPPRPTCTIPAMKKTTKTPRYSTGVW